MIVRGEFWQAAKPFYMEGTHQLQTEQLISRIIGSAIKEGGKDFSTFGKNLIIILSNSYKKFLKAYSQVDN